MFHLAFLLECCRKTALEINFPILYYYYTVLHSCTWQMLLSKASYSGFKACILSVCVGNWTHELGGASANLPIEEYSYEPKTLSFDMLSDRASSVSLSWGSRLRWYKVSTLALTPRLDWFGCLLNTLVQYITIWQWRPTLFAFPGYSLRAFPWQQQTRPTTSQTKRWKKDFQSVL